MGSESGKKLEAVLTEASIKFRINNVSELKEAFYGPSVNVDGICFRPMVNQTEDKKRRFTNLGLFLHCDLPAGVETCNAKMHFTLFAQDRKTENKTLEGSHIFNGSGNTLGCKAFIPWSELIKPVWMVKDSIFLEVKIMLPNYDDEERAGDNEKKRGYQCLLL